MLLKEPMDGLNRQPGQGPAPLLGAAAAGRHLPWPGSPPPPGVPSEGSLGESGVVWGPRDGAAMPQAPRSAPGSSQFPVTLFVLI